MKKFFTVALAAALILGTSHIVTAQPFRDGRMAGIHGQPPSPLMMFRLLQTRQAEFKINDQQMEQIRLKALALEKEQIQMKHQRDLLQLELKTLTLEATRDYREIKTVLLKLAELKADFRIRTMKTRDAVEGILTGEQLAAIRKAMETVAGRRHENLRGRTGHRRGRSGIAN